MIWIVKDGLTGRTLGSLEAETRGVAQALARRFWGSQRVRTEVEPAGVVIAKGGEHGDGR